MEFGFLATGSSRLICDGFNVTECPARDVKIAADYVSFTHESEFAHF